MRLHVLKKKSSFFILKNIFCVLVLLLFLSSCGNYKPTPKIPARELQGEARTTVIHRLLETDAQISSLKSLSRLQIEEKGQKTSLRELVMLQRPDKLHFQTLPLNGVLPLSLLVSRQGMATFYLPQEKKAYQGDPESIFMKSFLHLPAGEEEIISFFTGRVPRRYLTNDLLKIYQENNEAPYTLVYGDFIGYWEVDPVSLLTKHAEFRDQFKGTPLIGVNYAELIEEEGKKIPTTLEIVSHVGGEQQIRLLLTGAKVNESLKDSAFDVQIPDGVDVVR